MRKANELPWLRPDGKSQVTIEYAYGRPKRIDTVLVSTQHAPGVPQAELREGVIETIIKPVLPPALVDKDLKIFVNPTGSFEVGGPLGDSGADRTQDHRRHLRRDGAPRRRVLQR